MCLNTLAMPEQSTLQRMLILLLLTWLLMLQFQTTLKLQLTFKRKWTQTKRQAILQTPLFKPTLTHFLQQ